MIIDILKLIYCFILHLKDKIYTDIFLLKNLLKFYYKIKNLQTF